MRTAARTAIVLALLTACAAHSQVVNLWPGVAPGSESWTQKERSVADTPRSAGHKPEVHIFSAGGHGFGLRKQGTSSDHWIDEFYDWLEAKGLTRKAGKAGERENGKSGTPSGRLEPW